MLLKDTFSKKPSIELLPQKQPFLFTVKSFSKPCVDFHWHFHPEFELTYIEHGKGVRYIGESVMSYASGDLFLLGPNIPHSFGSDPKERTGSKWSVMHFSPEYCGLDFWKLFQNRNIQKLFLASEKGVLFQGEVAKKCASLMKRLESPLKSDVPLARWLEILDMLAKSKKVSLNALTSNSISTQKTIDSRLQKVLAWINDQADFSKLSQKEASKLVGMSAQSFCRFFHHHTGRPFHRYVNELRIARASSRLINSNQSISFVAFQCGFENLSYFNRRFLEITGCTPRQYRDAQGGNADSKRE